MLLGYFGLGNPLQSSSNVTGWSWVLAPWTPAIGADDDDACHVKIHSLDPGVLIWTPSYRTSVPKVHDAAIMFDLAVFIGDFFRLRQCCVNLVDNAIKYCTDVDGRTAGPGHSFPLQPQSNSCCPSKHWLIPNLNPKP